MKNFIKYYYDIDIDNYDAVNNTIVFNYQNVSYELDEYYGDINSLMRNYSLLITYNIYCHEIVLNKDNLVISSYENKNYILFKRNIDSTNIINLDSIKNYDKYININEKIMWKKLWIEKLDYYEYQISELGLKYKKLKESFSYYSSLSEIAINLLNYVNYNNVSTGITHKRILYNEDMNSFTNIVNITIDNITRDIAEYIKINILNDNMIDLEYIDKFNLSNDEYILLMARMLYPSYYFDIYDRVIQEENETLIDEVIKKNNSFESFLRKIYLIIKERSNIPSIDWLHNSNNF